MRELRKKTTITILLIFSLMLVAVLIFLNVRNYNREHEDIEKSLAVFDGRFGERTGPGGDMKERPGERRFEPGAFENAMIMDYEVYTVEIDGGEISQVNSHGYEASDFDVEGIAEEIIRNDAGDSFYIPNLHTGDYSYKYRYMDSIVIVNNAEVAEKLKMLLLESAILFAVIEAALYFLSRVITGWLVTPAEKAFSKQKEFIADASHELKTPLAVIMASSDELDANADPKDPNRKYIDHIRYETDRMSRLIQGLLNLSRLEDGNEKASFKEENLTRILEKSCLAYEGVAFEQGVGIREDIEENLSLKCSKDEIEKMISTILDNAVKHSYRDTEVRVSAKRIRSGIMLKVINTGDPIKDEDRERIFERFYRADKSRNRSEGRYGLGLAIAKQVVINHNGTIRAYSAGGDTTFEILLKN